MSDEVNDAAESPVAENSGPTQGRAMNPFCWAVVCDGELYGTCDTEDDAWVRLSALAELVPDRDFNVVGLFTESECHVFVQKNLTLTDAEREAVETARMLFAQGGDQFEHAADSDRAVTLRGLLDRHAKGGGE